MKNRKWKTPARLLVCFVLLLLMSAAGLMDKQKIWPGVPVEYLQGKAMLSLEEGDVYSTVTAGPYTELPAGKYRLKWQIEGDGVNVIELKNSNDVVISPNRFETTPGTFEGEAYFELEDTIHNFSIQAQFCDGSWMSVHNFRLYSPIYRDHYFTVFVLMIAVIILTALYESGKLTRERRETMAVLAIAVCFASLPALREDMFAAHDVGFHAVRIHNLLDSLMSGQFPGRVGGYSYNGYGAVTSVFYPDLLLYPFALLLHLGASMTYVLNVLTVSMNALTAVCMYAAAKRIFRDRNAGIFAAVVYVCCGFRLDRLYGSFMVGQMMAMAVLPVFLLGMWEVFFGDKSRWPVLTLGATLVFQSHMLTTLMCAGVSAVALVCFGRRIWREKRIGALVCAVVWTLVLNLTTIVPLLTTYLSGVTTSVGAFGFVDLTHEVIQLLGPDKEMGLAMLLGLSALVCVDGAVIGKDRRHTAVIMAALGVICAWMSTDMFPWRRVFALTGGIFEILQFSWRFLAISTVCLSLCAGLGYACLLRDQGAKGLLAVLAVAVLCVSPVLMDVLDREIVEFGTDGSPYILHPEYQFEGTDLEATRSRAVLTRGDVVISQYEKEGTRITAQLQAKTDAVVTMPLFGFDGYAAELDGQRIMWTRGENNRLAVGLPAGTQGELRIWYEGNLLWHMADIASLAGLLSLCTIVIRGRRAIKRNGGTGS